MKYFWFISIVLLSFGTFAQELHFELLTKDDGLPSNEVYDVEEDNLGRIYIATNEGFVLFINGEFRPIPTESGEMPSGTGLYVLEGNRVFCHSFDGRLFEIKEERLHLFKDFRGQFNNLMQVFADESNLIVFSYEKLFHYNLKSNQWEMIDYANSYPAGIHNGKFILELTNRTNSYYDFKTKKVVPMESSVCFRKKIELDSFQLIATLSTSDKMNISPFIYCVANNLRDTTKLAHIDGFFELGKVHGGFNFEKKIYIHGTNGLLELDSNFKILNHYFKNQDIGNMLVDRNGQIWASSARKGLFRCPFSKIRKNRDSKYSNVKSISSNKNRILFQSDYNIIVRDGKAESSIKSDEYIKDTWSLNKGFVYVRKNKLYLSNPQKKVVGIGAVKDIVKLNDTVYIVAMNVGTSLLQFDDVMGNTISRFSYQSDLSHKNYLTATRTNAICFDNRTEEIWLCTQNSLLVFNPNQTVDTIKYQGKAIQGLDIIQTNENRFWVASSKGVYIIEDKKVITKIDELNGLHQLKVKKLIHHNDFVHFVTSSGVQSFHEEDHYFDYVLTKTEGLPSNEVLDADVFQDTLFIATKKGLYQVALEDLSARDTQKPSVSLRSSFLNGKKINGMQNLTYGFSQLELNFDVVATNSGKDFMLAYALSGDNFTYLENGNSKITLSDLSDGEQVLKVKVVDAFFQESEVLAIPFGVRPPYYKAWWFYILIFVGLLVLTITFFIIRIRIVRKRLTLEKKLKASEITAIKSQMNPHFIFNALNSIQELILQKDVRNSNIYLGKFSDLVRMVLSLSDKPNVNVLEEIDLLNKYLELEQLRFKKELIYEITNEVNDVSKFNLPSLLIQPYVENSIKHGLLHKEGEKKLEISFYESKNHFHCKIEDNGIGRIASEEIKKRRSKYHQSFSTSANEKRLELINQTEGNQISLKVTDLNNPTGTIVEFKFKKK